MTTFDFGQGPVPAHRHINPSGTLGGWVADTATVAATVYVSIDAQVYGSAEVTDAVQILGQAKVYGNAKVRQRASVAEFAEVYGSCEISGSAYIYGKSQIKDEAKVMGSSSISGTVISGNSVIDASFIIDTIIHDRTIYHHLHGATTPLFKEVGLKLIGEYSSFKKTEIITKDGMVGARDSFGYPHGTHITEIGSTERYWHGMLHCTSGSAVSRRDEGEYWLSGHRLTKEEFIAWSALGGNLVTSRHLSFDALGRLSSGWKGKNSIHISSLKDISNLVLLRRLRDALSNAVILTSAAYIYKQHSEQELSDIIEILEVGSGPVFDRTREHIFSLNDKFLETDEGRGYSRFPSSGVHLTKAQDVAIGKLNLSIFCKAEYLLGIIHIDNSDGEAINVHPDGTCTHMKNGVTHNRMGPAIIRPNGENEYYLSGLRVTHEEFQAISTLGHSVRTSLPITLDHRGEATAPPTDRVVLSMDEAQILKHIHPLCLISTELSETPNIKHLVELALHFSAEEIKSADRNKIISMIESTRNQPTEEVNAGLGALAITGLAALVGKSMLSKSKKQEVECKKSAI